MTHSNEGNGTFFRDMLMLALMGFVAMVLIMLPHLNPPKPEESAKPPGNLVAYIMWKPGDIDVDLWLTGPGERKPVGYSRKSGALWDLLRDDVGTLNDSSGLNFENAYTRGLVPGEYVISVHCYACSQKVLPVEVRLELSVKRPGSNSIIRLLTTSVALRDHGQELIMVRFTLTKEGTILPGSLSRVYGRSLRHGGPL